MADILQTTFVQMRYIEWNAYSLFNSSEYFTIKDKSGRCLSGPGKKVVTVTSYQCYGVCDHRQLDCLFNSPYRLTTKKHQNSSHLHLKEKSTGNHRPVAHIQQSTSPTSHNAPFCNRNVHTRVHISVTKWCMVGSLMHCGICEMGLRLASSCHVEILYGQVYH